MTGSATPAFVSVTIWSTVTADAVPGMVTSSANARQKPKIWRITQSPCATSSPLEAYGNRVKILLANCSRSRTDFIEIGQFRPAKMRAVTIYGASPGSGVGTALAALSQVQGDSRCFRTGSHSLLWQPPAL